TNSCARFFSARITRILRTYGEVLVPTSFMVSVGKVGERPSIAMVKSPLSDVLRPHRTLAARRPLRRQDPGAAGPLQGIRPHAGARGGRGRLAAGAGRRARLRAAEAVFSRDARRARAR